MRYRNTLFAAVITAGLAAASCAAPEPSETASPDWSVYEVQAASLEFEYRSDWQVEQVEALANDPAGGVSLRVHDADGDVIAWLDTGIITDQVCMGMQEPVAYTEYDSQMMPDLESEQGTEQRFVYRSVAPAAGEALVTYAVVSTPPPSAEEAACGLFDFFTLTEASGGRFAGVVRPDEGSDMTAHLEKASAFAGSGEYRDVRRMLVSLRNSD
ncbi:hypothetical protein [Arthrobacter luteolus]|uniref:hypothetical protein n=1 Tax=Arthrobacter luteolus TaxID=98672 RepID=UPI00384FF3EB